MLSETEFNERLSWGGLGHQDLLAHDREMRAEIERLKILLDATLALHAFACAEIIRLGGSPPAPDVK